MLSSLRAITIQHLFKLITQHTQESKQLIEIAKESINKLVELGADYKHFQSAQFSHKNLKKIQKLISPIH